jgi:hypothetical protein
MTANYKVVKLATHDSGFPRRDVLGNSVNKGKLFADSRHKHLIEKAKIVHLAHVLSFAWVHHTGVKRHPAGESGWKEQRVYVGRE